MLSLILCSPNALVSAPRVDAYNIYHPCHDQEFINKAQNTTEERTLSRTCIRYINGKGYFGFLATYFCGIRHVRDEEPTDTFSSGEYVCWYIFL